MHTNTTLTNVQFKAFMEVIDACNNGRYMYGNGGTWYIVDTLGNKVCIDTTTPAATTTPVPTYVGTARTCYTTANSLEDFLMGCDGKITTDKQEYNLAYRNVASLVINRYCVFTNGGQWYMYTNGNVSCYELGTLGEWATVRHYDALSSWKYIKSNGNTPITETQSIKDYLKRDDKGWSCIDHPLPLAPRG
jgi:hypothetical protein